jgi:hypothetical protein
MSCPPRSPIVLAAYRSFLRQCHKTFHNNRGPLLEIRNRTRGEIKNMTDFRKNGFNLNAGEKMSDLHSLNVSAVQTLNDGEQFVKGLVLAQFDDDTEKIKLHVSPDNLEAMNGEFNVDNLQAVGVSNPIASASEGKAFVSDEEARALVGSQRL